MSVIVIVRSGDPNVIVEKMGFVESKFKYLEWTKSIGDYKFFIYYSRLAWRLSLCKYGTDGQGQMEHKYSGAFESLEELKKIYAVISRLHHLEELQ